MTGMETDAEARAVLEIIRRNAGPGGTGRTSVYSSEYRQDYENDSSTDEEPMEDNSSDEEGDFVSKYGKISTQTSKRGKVRISNRDGKEMEEGAPAGEVDSDDDFEADMALELKERVQAAERNAALTTGQPEDQADDEDIGDLPDGGGDSGPAGPAVKDGKYSDIYFDSDEEEEEAARSGKRNVKSNDELLYDPEKDDEDQVWVDDVRRSYQLPGQKRTLPSGTQKLPNSDAVLNCPACFTVLCLDCQRHALYKTQYRAMFVINCTVLTDQKLKFPVTKKAKKGKGKGRAPVLDPSEEFHPVQCDSCKTEVAMYDTDEVYHFFNVVASHT